VIYNGVRLVEVHYGIKACWGLRQVILVLVKYARVAGQDQDKEHFVRFLFCAARVVV